MINTPQEIFTGAYLYMRIFYYSFPFMYLFFLISSILRGFGDTMTPIYFLIVSTLINGILDPILINGFGPIPALGIEGAAYASLIAQGCSILFAVLFLFKKNRLVIPSPTSFNLDSKIFVSIVKIGFPTVIQQILLSLGTIVLATFIDLFGTKAISAYGAVMRIDTLIVIVAISLGAATTALVGQNAELKDKTRMLDIYKWGMLLAIIFSLAVQVISIGIPQIVLRAFVQDKAVLDIGIHYMRIVGIGYLFYTIAFVPIGIFNGVGKTMVSTIITLISMYIVRIPLVWLACNHSIGLTGIWFAIILSNLSDMLIGLAYYYFGNWKNVEKQEVNILEQITVPS